MTGTNSAILLIVNGGDAIYKIVGRFPLTQIEFSKGKAPRKDHTNPEKLLHKADITKKHQVISLNI
jgi:hypothetical protein